VRDGEKAHLLWRYATAVTGAQWPAAKSPMSPCPTLTVISAVTAVLDKKEQMDKARNMGKVSPSGNLGKVPNLGKAQGKAQGKVLG